MTEVSPHLRPISDLPEPVSVEIFDGGMLRIETRCGLYWDQAPLPPRFHRCRPWTVGFDGLKPPTRRCACGAISFADIPGWSEKNARRKKR
jgi:hypothetical protein